MKNRKNSYSSSSPAPDNTFPIIVLAAFVMMPLLFSDDTQEDYLMDAMTAESAESAVRHGMMGKLAPYFTACQQEAGIPAGAQSGVTRAQAETAEACLFRAHEDDPHREGRLSGAFDKHLRVTNAESLDAALSLGLFEYLAPYWAACRDQLGINAGTNPATTRADHEEFEACLYNSYEEHLETGSNAPRP